MFRRPGKPPTDKESVSPLYQEESKPYTYGQKTPDLVKELSASSRPFEAAISAHPLSRPSEERSHEEIWTPKKMTPLPHPFQGGVKAEEPETTLGEGVSFRGELKFERLLRIDGFFEGDLISKGKVIVGAKGRVKANLNLSEALIEGSVEGNITVVGRLELRHGASVLGDIKASSLSVDDGVKILGLVEVLPEISSSDTEITG